VRPERVELVSKDRVSLGGIRYVTREPKLVVSSTLGLDHAKVAQDLFVYVLDRTSRYEPKNYESSFLPTNVEVEPRAKERLGAVYNALFDAAQARRPEAFFTEFAWSTRGCGEPCPDAPLSLDELLTLGGDVLEDNTTTAKERAPAPVEPSAAERRELEARLRERPPASLARARLEQARELGEIGRRRALAARQTYVLTRLHHRYDRSALPRDVELAPGASPMSGGVGVPKGPAHVLTRATAPASEDRIQVRFTSFHPWTREIPCGEAFRFRWGKRWPSRAREERSVFLATDLARQPTTPTLLREVLRDPLSEIGVAPFAPAPPPKPLASAPLRSDPPESRRGCSVPVADRGGAEWLVAFAALGSLVSLARCASRRR
jgi:hypothetical protein